MKSNLFNQVAVKKPARSYFDHSHDVKLSTNLGLLTPVCCIDCLPGDTVNIAHQSLIRFAPMVAPVMHRFDCYVHYFFVPNRILWDNWEDYITNTKTAGVLPAFPFITVSNASTNYTKLMDYLGVPYPGQTPAQVSENISAMPFAAYQKIFNEYYRDQNLVPELIDELTDGDNNVNFADLCNIRRRAWEHDYLTSALPFAQKGDPVDIPLGEVELRSNWDAGGRQPHFVDTTDTALAGALANTAMSPQVTVAGVGPNAYDPDGTLVTGATTINDLRLAFRLQEYLERNARVGTRYIEYIKGQFNVNSSDKRLQRPEYICGSKTPVTISEVLNTTGTIGELPQGNMAGHGVAFANAKEGRYYSEEHGYVIGIMSIMPKTAYQQGMPKHFSKINDPFDFAVPVFANIGEQPILNKEVMAFVNDGEDTFGYIPRYAEYKFTNSRVAGEFRTSLDYWHLSRILDQTVTPALNADFINCVPDFRIFAVVDPDVDHLYIHFLNQIGMKRQLPRFGTPTL